MKRVLAMSLVLALAGIGCGKNNDSTTSPTTTTKTESFTGSVAVGGSAMNPFTVAAAGQVMVTLTAAGPPATVPVGLGIGTPANSVCAVLPGGSVNVVAGSVSQLSGIVTPGSYCVTVFDIGGQTGAITYSVTVVHP